MESCREAAIIRFGDKDIVLETEDPPLEKEVLRPGEPFIDCEGTMRLMAWILEGDDDNDPPALRLTHRSALAQLVSFALVASASSMAAHIGTR